MGLAQVIFFFLVFKKEKLVMSVSLDDNNTYFQYFCHVQEAGLILRDIF